jgi:processing peptidase subunit beta
MCIPDASLETHKELQHQLPFPLSPLHPLTRASLWGIYLVTDKLDRVDDLVHFSIREWMRLCTNVTEAEVERAKAQLKASILLSLDGTTALAEDIGRQIITTGRRMSPAEVERNIDAITDKSVMDFASRKLWDQDIAVSAVGSIEALFDYQRLRNTMKPKF